MQLDFKAIAAGVIKNNMGVGGIELRVRGKVQDGTATFAETGQALPVSGAPPSSSRPWLAFDVRGWSAKEQVMLVWKAEQDAPASK